MDVGAYIESLIKTELNGDSSRFDELWDKVPNFGQKLREFDSDSAWLHWRPKTYDGWYCVKDGAAYKVYSQERGHIDFSKQFLYEREAVRFAIDSAAYPLKPAI